MANKIINEAIEAAKKDPSAANVHKLYVEGKRALKGDTTAQQELFKRLRDVRPEKDWYGKDSYKSDPKPERKQASTSANADKPERKRKSDPKPEPVVSLTKDEEGYLLDSAGKRVGHVDDEIDRLVKELNARVSGYVERKAQEDARAKAKRQGLVLDANGNIIGAEDPALNALIQAGLKATAPKAKRTSKKASK